MINWIRRILGWLFGNDNGRNSHMGDTRPQMPQHQDQRQEGPPITLFAKAVPSNGGVEWSLGKENPPTGKYRVELQKGAPAQEIVIHLIATGGLDITFDRSDPVWAGETGCPPPKDGKSDQLEVVDCKDNKLTLRDPNTRECTIYYQMNFIGAEPFDPEIRNGGPTFQ